MKHLTIMCCLIFFGVSNLNAQSTSYTNFEWDIVNVGFAIPVSSDQITGGVAMGGELRYNFEDAFSFGFGTDLNFFDLKKLDDNGDGTIGTSFSSYLVTDYYFNTYSPNRAYVGFGLGISTVGDLEIEGENDTFIEGESGLSLIPRIGYELGHVRFTAAYNIGLKKGLTDYMAFKVAFTLWGGYKG